MYKFATVQKWALKLHIIFATTNSKFEEITYSDMHHRMTYMYVNFQQIRVSRSVNTVHTNIFAKNRKLHTFATTGSNFEKKSAYLRHASSYNVHAYQFSANPS